MNRKLKKLIKDPNLFFSDMLIKQKKKIDFVYNRKVDGKYQFTVVSAVYNVGRYLDDYFKSFVNQRLNFKKHIHLILVDDGSTDQSAEIIKKWQSKYPQNITYLWKENGGQASARNLGLKHVKTPWVTFIDSDDFVDRDYFYHVDLQLAADPTIKIICCNQIYYFEESNIYIDRHPLNYRFKNEKSIFPSTDLDRFMQFSAPLAFFHVPSIPPGLYFDETLKPTFEDGKFVSLYLLSLRKSNICFYAKPKYYNRKREDKSSTMDNAWGNKGQYGVVLENGYLPVLNEYKKTLTEIPVFMQRTILWELLRLIKHLVDKEYNVSFLSIEEKEHFLDLMDRTFRLIDDDVILNFELGSCGFSRQVGMLGCFKKSKPPKQVIYVDKYDESKKEILIRYFTCSVVEEEFYINGQVVYPSYVKESCRYLLNRVFLVERRIWLPVIDGNLSVKIDGQDVNINYFGKRYKKNVNLKLDNTCSAKNKEKILVFMDRDDSAGDNAEFLYKYVSNESVNKCYFVLGDKTHDWQRLKLQGFNLIAHGSSQHSDLLEKCDLLISSQIGSIINPFENITTKYKTVFLQHGVTKDDISSWINNCKIDLIITASKMEYQSIVNNDSRYIYGEKEVKLTGFPRFDSLHNDAGVKKKQLLILFTWRKSIAGRFVNNKTSEREFNNDFVNTNYYKTIKSLLTSEKLSEYAKVNDLSIVFCPHPNVRPYMELFEFSDNIRVSGDDESIHNLLKTSSMLITDYSSVAFDFAYMKKPLCYYQFDGDDFFNGEHTYTQGYFDYLHDGFGPVIDNEESLFEYLNISVSEKFNMDSYYIDRVDDTFLYQDKDNCKRVSDAINAFLNNRPSPVNSDIVIAQAERSYSNKCWHNSAAHWEYVLDYTEHHGKNDATLKKIISLREVGEIDKALSEFNRYFYEDLRLLSDSQRTEKANIYFCYGKWDEVVKIWSTNSFKIKDRRSFILYLLAIFQSSNSALLKNYVAHPSVIDDDVLATVLACLCESLVGNFEYSVSTLKELIDEVDSSVLIECRLELVLVSVFIKYGDFDSAQKLLELYEKHSKLDPCRRYFIVNISAYREQWIKVINQIESLTNDENKLSEELAYFYLIAIKFKGNLERYIDISTSLINTHPHSKPILIENAEGLILKKDFEGAEKVLRSIDGDGEFSYRLAYVLRMQGKLKQALSIILSTRVGDPSCFNDWLLKAEILELNIKWDDAAKCWVEIMKKFPQQMEDKYLTSFYNSQILSKLER